MKRTLLAITLGGLVGCSTVHEKAVERTTDPKTGIVTERTASVDIGSVGTAKTLVENAKATNGKTQGAGVKSVNESVSLAELIQALQLLNSLKP